MEKNFVQQSEVNKYNNTETCYEMVLETAIL